jgi:hypothetical protein
VAGLAKYFGEVPHEKEPEVLLSRINAFAVSFCKACRDNERADHLRKKQEQARAHHVARQAGKAGKAAAARPRSPAARRPQSKMLGSIGDSLRRGQFGMMKQLQEQMSIELNKKVVQRRGSLKEDF